MGVVRAPGFIGERRELTKNSFPGGVGWGSTPEEIIKNRRRRKQQLQNLVNTMKKKLADHSAGEITLELQEKADMERRLDLYSRKLDTLKHELDEKVRLEKPVLP
jgi:hypothetical protein